MLQHHMRNAPGRCDAAEMFDMFQIPWGIGLQAVSISDRGYSMMLVDSFFFEIIGRLHGASVTEMPCNNHPTSNLTCDLNSWGRPEIVSSIP